MAPEAVDDSHLAAAGTLKPGSIKQILLKNFLTFKDVIITPGARLNIVVGANGTGKSTILNAICLGLGGEPKLLGRADDARDFVMHGEDEASITITLAPKPGMDTHVIERVIDRRRGKEKGNGRGASTFFINGEKVNVKEVRELVSSEYKITIDNLCTFLPQDKVSSFSSMSEQDRLRETEKTLSEDYYNMHLQLVEAVDEISENAGSLESLKQKLKKYKHENEKLERAAALVEERQKILDEASLIEKKKLWAEYDLLREQAMEIKEAKGLIKKKVTEITSELQPLQEKADRLQALRQKAEADYKAYNDETNRCKKEIEKQSNKYDNHDDTIEDIIMQLSELDSKRSRLELDAKAKQARLDEVEKGKQGFPSPEVADADLKQAQAKRREAMKSFDRAKRQEQDVESLVKELQEQGKRFQQMVAKLDNEAESRKKHVYRKFPKLHTITTLIGGDRGRFRRQVWGPVACEVTAKNKGIAAMLEFHAPKSCLMSYVVEEKRDYDRLYKWVREEMNLGININLIPNGELKQKERFYSEEKMAILKQQHGIQGYLDECFTAPDAIMQSLRNAAQVQRVLIGNDTTMDSIDNKGLLNFLSKPEAGQDPNKAAPFCVFATRGQTIIRFTGKVSRYTGKITISQDQIREASFLTTGVNEQEKQAAEAKLAEVHQQADDLRPKAQEAQHIRRQLESEAQDAQGEVEAAQKMKSHIVKYQSKHDQAKRNLQEALAALNTNDAEEKESLLSALMNRVSNSITALGAHAEQQESMMKATIASAGAAANKSSVSAVVAEAKVALQEKQAAHAETEQEARRLQADFSKTKKRAIEKKATAAEKAPLEDENGNDTELKRLIATIPFNTVAELQVAHEEAMARANDIADDPNAVRQYERRKKDIAELEVEVVRRANADATRAERIKAMADKWEGGLTQHISQVNKLFAKYMAEMDCAGEIVLSKGKDNVSNYKDWGIQILVSFREGTKVQALSAARNSGGERSVCTIMYLMALQEMMVAPFRCVDEINQGLDERNERLVFKRIVANSCRPPSCEDSSDHSGQYFLITPKLLPNLTDMEDEAVTVLFVMNGTFAVDASDTCVLHCTDHVLSLVAQVLTAFRAQTTGSSFSL
ncbi:hypothetical protein MPSEU_000890800 [Mayamaea pseudoterrestris]|nr:hypothetical protein MPSEU_000890800 [Mayamaea pseudoterrestris]